MKNMQRLLEAVAALRDARTGCLRDRQQDFHSMALHTVEEAYEVADAIERRDMQALRDELGNMLLQVVFHARMAEEQGIFVFADVVQATTDKLLTRCPHASGDATCADRHAQKQDWEPCKAEERGQKSGNRNNSVLGGVPTGLPGLTRAVKLQQRAASVGFDWPEMAPVLAKIREEISELETEIACAAPHTRILDELGDVLFAVANLARKLDADPEQALRGTNRKFERRFAGVETELAKRGKYPEEATLEEMDAIWEQVKHDET